MRKDKRIFTKYIIIGFLAAVFICGCGSEVDERASTSYFYKSMNSSTEKEALSEETEEEEASGELYLIVDINSALEKMRVYRYENKMEYQYYYGMDTEFLNKYGDHTSVANFKVGDAINIAGTDKDGRVTEIRKSKDVWVYDDIVNFSTNLEDRELDIAGTGYELGRDTYIFSGDKEISIFDLSSEDKISVVGNGSKILSISVMTGHGVLSLENTDLFDGSFIQLNQNIFTEITHNMSMDLPEGEYQLTVANNGWGGTVDINISRGETTTVDLDKIKGEGPRQGKVKFILDVDEADVYIDGEEVDYKKAIELTYGKHQLVVMSDGYSTWKRTLYVNSAAATIVITLKDEDEKSDEKSSGMVATDPNSNGNTGGSDHNTNGNSNNNSNGNSNNNSNNNGSGNGDRGVSDDDLQDYLSTISSLVSAISS